MTSGHQDFDTQSRDAALERLHVDLGHTARQLWDVQKQRIMAGNRLAAMQRDGLDEPSLAPMRKTVEGYEGIEKGVEATLRMLARRHFMADWVKEQRGIGYPGFARLIGVTGDISRFPTVSKLWKYLGLHVVNGHAPKREKGVAWTHTDCTFAHLTTCPSDCKTDHHPSCVVGGIGTAYAPQGRVVCRQLAEAIVKVGGSWREVYDSKKAYYEAERPDWTQARRHNAAMRYCIKMLVKELWLEWHERRGHTMVDTQTSGAAPSAVA